MNYVLNRIPGRKIIREKGRSFSVIAAVFFTTALFVMVFSALFSIKDAAEEMQQRSAPLLSDVAIHVMPDEYEKICTNPRVAEVSSWFTVARTQEISNLDTAPLMECEAQMAQWARLYPTTGRMPEKGNEIVVSDQFIRERGLTYSEGMPVEITFTFLDDKEFTDTFTVVGVYKRALQPYHAVMVSSDFHDKAYAYWEQCGIDPQDEEAAVDVQVAGIMFSSRGNVRKQLSMLAEESEVDLKETEIFLNDTSLFSGMSMDTWAVILMMILLVMWLGYLFISNIFQLSVSRDARFYGKLSTNGITKREIKRLIRRQNRLLFLAGVVPALFAGYFFSAAVLPSILSGFATVRVERSSNILLFVLAFFFSYLTVLVSERGAIRLAKNASPIEMKRYMGGFRRVKTADDGDCMKKIALRQFKSDKRKVAKVCISIAVSILLANVFYAVTAGFDREAYVREELGTDYILEKESLLLGSNVNALSYERIKEEEIAGYRDLPGIEEAGGASKSHIALPSTQGVLDALVEVCGENPYESDTESGELWTHVYGLDDMLLQKLEPIRGTIDLEKFHTGNYVLVGPIYGDNTEKVAAYEPGDQVTIPYESGEEGTYTVMAVVDELPYSLAFPLVWSLGSVYLPREEWMKKEKRNDYYLYTFDVAEEYHEIWEETLAEDLGEQSGGLGLGYRSAKTVADGAERYISGLKLAGFGLSLILLSMGVLNFVNCMAQSVYSRSRELAVLESMGIEQEEIERNLSKEGLFYMAGGFVSGCVLAALGVYVLICRILQEPYITYHFYLRIDLLFAVLGYAVTVLVPITAYRMMDRKQKFLDRIRSCRE